MTRPRPRPDIAHALARVGWARIEHRPRPHSVVIAGAGIAGLRAAERLRERGFDGQIVFVGEEPHKPYNRTPLSKQLLARTGRLGDLKLPVFSDLDAIWRLGTRALGLDVARNRLLLARGEEVEYDGLVIATGVEARHLPGTPLWSDHVWTLRDMTDARGLSRRLADGARHIAVIGTGFIGCEIASSLRGRGLDVTVIGRGGALMSSAIGKQVGGLMTRLHRNNQVALLLGRNPVRWATADSLTERPRSGAGVSIWLDDGGRVDADVAVVAVGALPATRWLQGSGLDVTDGVLTGPTTHAVYMDGTTPVLAPSVVAAGDVARWPNLLFDWTPRRVEHWITASEHGQAAADALLLGPDQASAFTPTPRFWTEQFGVRLQGVGRPGLADACCLAEGSTKSLEFVAVYTRQGVVVGAVSANAGVRLLEYADLIGWPLDAPTPAGMPAPRTPMATV
ncbi:MULTISPECIES: NAD(P)/FAD-dependent oxidoreductase [unclassified Pseudofrankia]|uniref:NAD(P)/FAD-dependent oxidoreductase n=1 Tax=unclassified Pseudofrankia TaxID=2994372 RepID=UPI0008DA4A61|nr:MULTISPECIES: FAD-dependent oxidoreductase [unclassified Pseudofrankia]MDT3440376.1 FAD-dependent oxidoreductase [Pseudofrankia sp. BMG5.37]OHV60834.1 pyridine nucleotide-disulfide oxidoreductase [Pseudofrankia sp. BMG5.36]